MQDSPNRTQQHQRTLQTFAPKVLLNYQGNPPQITISIRLPKSNQKLQNWLPNESLGTLGTASWSWVYPWSPSDVKAHPEHVVRPWVKRVPSGYIYIYIYMCVCVCGYVLYLYVFLCFFPLRLNPKFHLLKQVRLFNGREAVSFSKKSNLGVRWWAPSI